MIKGLKKLEERPSLSRSLRFFGRLRPDQFMSVLAIALGVLSYGSGTPPAEAAPVEIPLDLTVYSLPVTDVPIAATSSAAATPALEKIYQDLESQNGFLTASAAAVIDLTSHAILFEKNLDSVYLPASTTKLMTALVAKRLFDLDELITIPEDFEPLGNGVKFTPVETLTVESLLKAMIIQSSNDAAYLLASHHSGGEAAFLQEMNDQAARYQLYQTRFANPAGFDSPDQASSPTDLAELSKIFMADPLLREITGTRQTDITSTDGQVHRLYNTHYLLATNDEVVGIKTGTTEGAGEVLLTQVERNGRPLLVVLMGSSDRYNETQLLYNWAYDRFSWLSIAD